MMKSVRSRRRPPWHAPRARLCVELLEDRNVLSGLTVSPNVNITRLTGWQGEGTIAVNPNNPQQLFAAWANLSGSLFARYSPDGGTTWADSNVRGVPAPAGGLQAAWDSFGNLFVTYLSGTNSVAVVARSADGGANLIDPRFLLPAARQPSIAVGPGPSPGTGSVWISAAQPGGRVRATGARVTGPEVVDPFGPVQELSGSAGGNFGGVAVGPAGQVLVTYQRPSADPGPSTIEVNLDPDGLGPEPFGPALPITATHVGDATRIPAQPAGRPIDAEANLAWDRSDSPYHGRVYLAYTDRPSVNSHDTDIFLRSSDDNGKSWSAPVRVNDDPTSVGRSQFNPALAVDQTTGNVALTWYDARDDHGVPGGAYTDNVPNNEVQVFGTVSVDGGSDFWPNTAISTGVMSGPAAGPFGLGGYDTMDFANGVFYRVWADNSVGPGALADNPGPARATDLATGQVWVPNSINGKKFNDRDGDGVQGIDEEGVAGVQIYDDRDNDDQLDDDETFTFTDARGYYRFTALPPGTYIIREVLPAGWARIVPAEGSYTIQLSGQGHTVRGIDFGNRGTGRICGRKVHDDGFGTSLGGLKEWKITLNTGQSVFTDEDGTYCFDNLPPGVYIVCEDPQSGWIQCYPDDCHTVPLAPDGIVSGVDFGNCQPVSASGRKFEDLNGDGVRNPGEEWLAGWTIYLDLNGNGQPDEEEPRTVTNVDGFYAFTGLRPGTYVVREVLIEGWQQTAPEAGFYVFTLFSGERALDLDFGNRRIDSPDPIPEPGVSKAPPSSRPGAAASLALAGRSAAPLSGPRRFEPNPPEKKPTPLAPAWVNGFPPPHKVDETDLFFRAWDQPDAPVRVVEALVDVLTTNRWLG